MLHTKFSVQKRYLCQQALLVPSLAWKCVFYRPEHHVKGDPMELNSEGLEMQKQNIPTYRAQ